MSGYLFTTCRAGSEAALKRDVARQFGGKLTPAFMRPQLVTWKVQDLREHPVGNLSPYARVSGTSLGLCRNLDEVVRRVCEFAPQSVRLHLYPRITPEDGVEAAVWQRIDEWELRLHRLLAQAGVRCETAESHDGHEAVLDVVVGETEDEPVFLGWHTPHAGAHRQPGGLPRLSLPDRVPSRAWLKLEQALAWRGWDTASWRGGTALDLGSAPGGASFSLIQRDMNVIGIDTGEMDELVSRAAAARGVVFEHRRVAAGKLDLHSLPEIDLLLCDINLAPMQVIPIIERIQRRIGARNFILTLKLNTPALEDQARAFIRAVATFAPAPVFATQLAGNRREICVCAGVK